MGFNRYQQFQFCQNKKCAQLLTPDVLLAELLADIDSAEIKVVNYLSKVELI